MEPLLDREHPQAIADDASGADVGGGGSDVQSHKEDPSLKEGALKVQSTDGDPLQSDARDMSGNLDKASITKVMRGPSSN